MKWHKMWRFLRGYGMITVEGCLVERLLETLRKEDLPLWNVMRRKNGVCFCTTRQGIRYLEQYAEEHPRLVLQIHPCGTLAVQTWTRRHLPLVLTSILLIATLVLSMQFYWRIDLSDVPISAQESVMQTLADANVTLPIRKSQLDTHALSDHLLLQHRELSFTQVRGRGVTLQVSAVLRAMPPQVLDVQSTRRDIIAPCDGTILSIAVTSGTAHVQAGDNVRAGDLLIEGITGSEGFTRNVFAQGQIEAQVVYSDTVTLQATEVAHATGNTAQQIHLVLFDHSIPICGSKGDFALYTESTERWELLFPQMHLPIYLERTIFQERELGSAAQQIFYAQQLALGKTMQSMHEQAQIIDTEYETIRQGDSLIVTCHLTAKVLFTTIQEVYAQ